MGAPTFFDGHLRPQDFHDDFNDNAQKMLPLGRFAFIKLKMFEFTSANSTLNMLNLQFHDFTMLSKVQKNKKKLKTNPKNEGALKATPTPPPTFHKFIPGQKIMGPLSLHGFKNMGVILGKLVSRCQLSG